MSPSSPELAPLPAPTIDGAAALGFVHRPSGLFEHLDWRSSLLSLLTHLLFVALVFALAYWMGKPPPPELPAIEVSLAQDPEPPPPPPPAREQPRPVPPPPPPSLPRASVDSSVGEGAPSAGQKNDAPSAQPAERSVAPREDKPAPQAKPVDKPEEAAAAPEQPRATPEPVPPLPAAETVPPAPPTPPVLATQEPRPTARPVAPPRAAPPPSLASRAVPNPAPAPPAELQPQRRAPESMAPAPSPLSRAEKADGPVPAIYDPYFAAINATIMQHRSLLKSYFGSSPRSEVRVKFVVDSAGRILSHRIVVSSNYGNLDYTIETMLAQSVPLPRPPADLLTNGTLSVLFVIALPSKEEDWRQAYP